MPRLRVSSERWVRSTRWNGLVADKSKVKVEGERGTFTFMEHVATETGQEWVSVFGPGETGAYRHFPTEKVRQA